MSRINTNVSSLVAQTNLARSNASLQTALDRLSTGLRINKGKDDPAGLIASENFRSDITATAKAISNSEQAGQVFALADSSLGQVSSLLNDIRGLVTESANSGVLSGEQIAANQLQVDASLEAIDRIAATTVFQGRRLLAGHLDFVISGLDSTEISSHRIDQANFGTASSVDVNVEVVTDAAKGSLTYAGNSGAATSIADAEIVITGSLGSETIQVVGGGDQADLVDQINQFTDATGVTATLSTDDIILESSEYGSDQFVEVTVASGTFATTDTVLTTAASRSSGTDVEALINGRTARSKGNTASINTSTLDLTLEINPINLTAGNSSSFTIEGGGAIFQLGPDVVSNQQARVGIKAINSALLTGGGGRLSDLRTGGNAALETDTTLAASIVDDVITEVTQLRGRLGAFERTTIDTNIAALNDTLVALTGAESNIRDADFAAETANLTRAQILVQAGSTVLGIANQNPQNVLALLR